MAQIHFLTWNKPEVLFGFKSVETDDLGPDA